MIKLLFSLTVILAVVALNNPEILANNSDTVRQYNLDIAFEDCIKGYQVGCNYYTKHNK